MTVLNQTNAYQVVLQAITVWRESRGESADAQRAVIWSINNRAARAAWWNRNTPFDIVEVVRFPEQYSSMTHLGDPNLVKFAPNTDPTFNSILAMCLNPGDDPTGGATHYFDNSIAEPSWAKEMEFTTRIGAFLFFKVP